MNLVECWNGGREGVQLGVKTGLLQKRLGWGKSFRVGGGDTGTLRDRRSKRQRDGGVGKGLPGRGLWEPGLTGQAFSLRAQEATAGLK